MTRKGKGLARYLMLGAAAATLAGSMAAIQAVPSQAQTAQTGLRAVSVDGIVEICLTNSPLNCLAWGPDNSIVLSADTAINWTETVNNPEIEAQFEADGLCLAAAPNSSGGNNRVYATSNCANNLFATWTWENDGRGGDFLLNQFAVNQGNPYQALTALNTREGAFLYVERQNRPDSWQTWTF
jgi:hypothetical protein